MLVFQIYLPHGTRVILQSTQIVIYPSIADVRATTGLCGWFDYVCGNDFLRPDGQFYPDPCHQKPDCSDQDKCNMREQMHEFATTWW